MFSKFCHGELASLVDILHKSCTEITKNGRMACKREDQNVVGVLTASLFICY